MGRELRHEIGVHEPHVDGREHADRRQIGDVVAVGTVVFDHFPGDSGSVTCQIVAMDRKTICAARTSMLVSARHARVNRNRALG
ncbi:hypothetical protein [uncultured Microbacterium sp.]|uniref:hypothetical protein n=1 Tax=uncultured Microbacterium sp. TaxID=191216 RepID=UPI0025D02BF3|nr:hypothetical protein [uncultured Microbacterium sp.]